MHQTASKRFIFPRRTVLRVVVSRGECVVLFTCATSASVVASYNNLTDSQTPAARAPLWSAFESYALNVINSIRRSVSCSILYNTPNAKWQRPPAATVGPLFRATSPTARFKGRRRRSTQPRNWNTRRFIKSYLSLFIDSAKSNRG